MCVFRDGLRAEPDKPVRRCAARTLPRSSDAHSLVAAQSAARRPESSKRKAGNAAAEGACALRASASHCTPRGESRRATARALHSALSLTVRSVLAVGDEPAAAERRVRRKPVREAFRVASASLPGRSAHTATALAFPRKIASDT